MLTIVAIADTHTYQADLVVPEGDVLIHAGDMCRTGSLKELTAARDYLQTLPHRHKIIIAGNHDRAFEKQPAVARSLFENFIYLQDQACTIEGVRFYGSPWTPQFYGAFNLPEGAPLAEKWALIPENTDVLITHGPPYGIGDDMGGHQNRPGSKALLARVQKLTPKLHLFGHIHEDRGRWQVGSTTFINVTTNECLYPPTVIQF